MDYSDYVIGGFASVGATLFTNPIEVIKTRIQLQGELAARGTYVEPYKGIVNAFKAVAKNDGWSGLQKGLVPALYFQFILNFFRLGLYNTAMSKGLIHDKNGDVSFSRGVFFGAGGGVIGAMASSPFFLIKTQLQSQAAKSIAVGYQHMHTGMFSALVATYSKRGIMGLWRGAQSNIPRAALGSGAQIATFGKMKSLLRDHDIIVHSTMNSFAAGAIAGSFMSLAITPPDVIATRLYNQGLDEHGKGLYYRGMWDCCVKILKTEGIHGMYKGFWANYLRIAPHSTLVLLFFDELLIVRDEYKEKKII
ncbi:solute carrier family 25 member 35-like [Eupeodes corollae]|uniref:solute carrier family 25 member 35-like n=1 Tax=Eupeodes corollae TaxID=290404 RepID=UPI0024903F2C|nr:solute carrier family 25 member 35-like [Eupeodes corollae]